MQELYHSRSSRMISVDNWQILRLLTARVSEPLKDEIAHEIIANGIICQKIISHEQIFTCAFDRSSWLEHRDRKNRNLEAHISNPTWTAITSDYTRVTSRDWEQLRAPGNVIIISNMADLREYWQDACCCLQTRQGIDYIDEALTLSGQIVRSSLSWHKRNSTCRRNLVLKKRTRIPRKRKVRTCHYTNMNHCIIIPIIRKLYSVIRYVIIYYVVLNKKIYTTVYIL